MARKQAHRRDGIYERPDRPGFWGSWTDASGRRRRKRFDFPTFKGAQEALEAEKHKVAEAKKFGRPLPSEDSFEAFAGEFLKYQEKRISPQVAKGKLSQQEYIRQKGIVEQHLKPFFGEAKLAAIRRSDVVRYMHNRTGEVSDGTIIKEINDNAPKLLLPLGAIAVVCQYAGAKFEVSLGFTFFALFFALLIVVATEGRGWARGFQRATVEDSGKIQLCALCLPLADPNRGGSKIAGISPRQPVPFGFSRDPLKCSNSRSAL